MGNKSMESSRKELTIDDDAIETSDMNRNIKGWTHYLFVTIAVTGALFHIYILNFHPIDPWLFRNAHLVLGLVLGFMIYPGYGLKTNNIPIIDWILIIISICIGWYIYTNVDQLLYRFGVSPTFLDTLISIIGLLLVLELTRRATGWILPLVSMVFVFYVFAGPFLPGFLNHNGYTIERFVTYVFSLDGVFGITLDVSSRYIILFIIFGAFLQMSGVGKYFINLALTIAGSLRGGPAKVSIIGSALMGTVNGTSSGNVVATGSLTIPLMRKTGFNPQFAAAVEATASSGGQILPPIMGAGVFLMAELTGIPYSEIIIAALIPALLYFVSVYFMVDFQSLKQGLKGMSREQLPSVKSILKKIHLLLPIIILLGTILYGFSIIRAGTISIIACFITSLFLKETRMGIKQVTESLVIGMKNAIQIIAIVACAGIVVGVISLTGVGQRFSSMLLYMADGNIILALLFAMGVCILLGLGMPTTAAYAVAASVIAPGIISLGVEPLVSHMFVFYFAIMSAITPPVALAAFAAAGIAGTDPMKTGIKAFQLGLAAYIIPFMFFFGPELLLMGESSIVIVLATVTAFIGVYLLAASIQGWFFKKRASWVVRILLLVSALMLMLPGWQTDIGAVFFAIVSIIIQSIVSEEGQIQGIQRNIT